VQAEHQVQLGLLRAFRATLERGDGDRAVGSALVTQLLEYSEVHFLSEQLLMRLYGYPTYDDHVLEHDRLIDRLHAIRRQWQQGELSATRELLDRLEDWLLAHMTTADDLLRQFLVESGRVPA
jgi:hemerythrin